MYAYTVHHQPWSRTWSIVWHHHRGTDFLPPKPKFITKKKNGRQQQCISRRNLQWRFGLFIVLSRPPPPPQTTSGRRRGCMQSAYLSSSTPCPPSIINCIHIRHGARNSFSARLTRGQIKGRTETVLRTDPG